MLSGPHAAMPCYAMPCVKAQPRSQFFSSALFSFSSAPNGFSAPLLLAVARFLLEALAKRDCGLALRVGEWGCGDEVGDDWMRR